MRRVTNIIMTRSRDYFLPEVITYMTKPLNLSIGSSSISPRGIRFLFVVLEERSVSQIESSR